MSSSLNIELNRRKTFLSWPSNAPVDPDNLSKNGFHATENYLETQCYFCHRIISDWQYNDQVQIRHRRLNPMCPLLVNPNGCNNVPLGIAENSVSGEKSQQQQELTDGPKVDLTNELNRLATFKNWPNPCISPQALAKAGFYYINQDDRVKCAWCKGIIAKWEKFDNAFEEHQRFFPDCPRVQLGPLIEIASDGIRDLGIQQICAPKKPKFSCFDARLRTYSRWPITEIQNPEVLSASGFYYQDIDDQVRCFHCNGGLRSWQKEDDPWFEHAKWFPHCQFLKLVKGQTYVIHVQETGRQSGTHETDPREVISTLDEAMTTEPVQRALEMGLNEGRILNVTRRQIECSGKPYDTTEELVEAVLDSQVDEEDDDGLEQSSSIVREVSQILNNIFNPRNGSNGDTRDDADYENVQPEEFDDFINFSSLQPQNSSTSNAIGAEAAPPSDQLNAALIHESEQPMSTCTSNEAEFSQNNPNIQGSSSIVREVSRVLNNIFNTTNGNGDVSEGDGTDFEEIPSASESVIFPNFYQNSTTNNCATVTLQNEDSNCATNSSNEKFSINSTNSTSRNNSTIVSTNKNSTINTINDNNVANASCSSPSTIQLQKQLSLEEENRKLKDARQCKVCMDDEVGVVFLPCGHLVTCVQCAPGVFNCPLCRTPIKGFVRTFLS